MLKQFYTTLISVHLGQYEIVLAQDYDFWQGLYTSKEDRSWQDVPKYQYKLL